MNVTEFDYTILLPALAAGKGDIAASNLTVTEDRKHLVDFTAPVYRNVSGAGAVAFEAKHDFPTGFVCGEPTAS
jgi:ABC-type amino acid transport substrate-binding protein